MNAIITGAGKGIGKAIALKLAQQGCHLAICARTEADLLQLQTHITQMHPGVNILAKPVDVSNRDQLILFAKECLTYFSTIDILVNNAGFFRPGTIHEEEEGLLEQLMSTNLYSAYHLTRQIVPTMKQQHKGHIFNICSTASLTAYPNGGAYSITKFALLGFSKNLREELKAHHVKVTAICPGPILTDSWNGFEGPADRLMTPADIADLLWSIYALAPQTVVEEVVLRPVLGDLE